MTPNTSEQAPKLLDATLRNKLTGMLRSTLLRWPKARLQQSTTGDFGVLLDAQTFVRVSISGNLTDDDIMRCCALFAVWLKVDPNRVRGRSMRGGFSLTGELD